MKATYLLSALGILISSQSMAQALNCQILENQRVIHENVVQTVLNQKVAIGGTNQIRGYVMEKENGVFIIEGFVPDYEVRIYAEGTLKAATDNIVATLWGRRALVEARCSL